MPDLAYLEVIRCLAKQTLQEFEKRAIYNNHHPEHL